MRRPGQLNFSRRAQGFVSAFLSRQTGFAHAPFDRVSVARAEAGSTPARDFGAYCVTFDGRALAAGESLQARAGVTLTRRC